MLETLRRRLGEDRGLSERDVGRQVCLLVGREADRTTTAADIAAAIDERIEHQFEKFVRQLKHGAFGAGRRFTVELRERIAERAAG